MAAGIPSTAIVRSYRFGRNPLLIPKPNSSTVGNCFLFLSPPTQLTGRIFPSTRSRNLTICFVMSEKKQQNPIGEEAEEKEEEIEQESLDENRKISAVRVAEKMARKRSERFTYLVAAMMSSFGITSMAIAAVYYRFSWQMEGGEIPFSEMFGTFALSVGAAVGMEFWARWAHRALWHASLWHMHESHHRPRDGPFELNDVFAIINAVPAIGLLSYGFFNKGLVPGLCFGAGLGITVFGMAYMFVHDGLVHRRFPVGPIANVPYFRKVAAAHQVYTRETGTNVFYTHAHVGNPLIRWAIPLHSINVDQPSPFLTHMERQCSCMIHHLDKFDGVPYGLFLGPKELEEVGGIEELEKEINKRIKLSKNST